MKNNVLFISLCLLPVVAFAQKEVYFVNNVENTKVESLKGIEITLNPKAISLIQYMRSQSGDYSFPLSIGYFSEKRIASNWTLSFRAVICTNPGIYNDYKSTYDSITGNTIQNIENPKHVYVFSLGLGLGVEPRWYWGYKNRYLLGTSQLNSGWFCSLPLQINITNIVNLHTPTTNPSLGFYNMQWMKDYFYLPVAISPTLGYRQAFSKKWFLEGGIALKISNGYFKDHYYSGLSNVLINPEINIKAAYTFK